MKIANWNNQPVVRDGRLISWSDYDGENVCPRGLGRSYGDASLDHVMLDMTRNIEFFHRDGICLELSSGFSLEEVLNRIVPEGYTLPVIPGTKHVTIGGMIAADVHGKNHVQKGSIGRWIEEIHLRIPDDKEIICSPTEHSELFHATIGGLGLTGIILKAKLKLEKISGTRWTQQYRQFINLDELIHGLIYSPAQHKTAWFDARTLNRFFLIENEMWEDESSLQNFSLSRQKITVPHLPFSLISGSLTRLYNWNYARKLKKGKKRMVDWDACFFPLDSIGNWNRFYGPRGFYQLQCVFPFANANEAYCQLLEKMQKARKYPVLSVMKIHGEHALPGKMSFTHPGVSGAFDFINTSGTVEFIRSLHAFIAENGGRIYLVKDALLSPENFERMYPEAVEFRNVLARYNSGEVNSFLAKRLNLVRT